MSKTVKQLADELGVSKTAIRKRFTDEFKTKYVQTLFDGSLQVSDEGCKLIVESLRKPVESLQKLPQTEFAETTANPSLQQSTDIQSETIELLKAQLVTKDKQIDSMLQQLSSKDEQIKKLTVALDNTTTALTAAQALHAGTLQERLIDNNTMIASENEVKIEPIKPRKKRFWAKFWGK